jgi:hypothetical protein
MLPDEIKGPSPVDSTDHGGETIHFDFISGWDEAALGLVLSSKTTV